jgi:hypothetical protein
MNKWHKYRDDEFMNQTVYWFDEYRESTHIDGHGIMIFSEKAMHPVAMLKRTQHTIVIRWGAYGETVHEEPLPFGTTITAAKAKAIELARGYNATDGANFIV